MLVLRYASGQTYRHANGNTVYHYWRRRKNTKGLSHKTITIKNEINTRRSQITLRPRCALPLSPSRTIPFAANAAATEWSLLLHDVIGDWVIPFAANALQCSVSEKKTLKSVPSPWDFVTLPEEDRATVIGNTNGKMDIKMARVVSEISSRTDRQTDGLITILRHRSRGRSNKFTRKNNFPHIIMLIYCYRNKAEYWVTMCCWQYSARS